MKLKIPGAIFDMMGLSTASMTLRQVFKGFLIFAFIVFLMSYGITAAYPTFRDDFTEEFVGTQDLRIEVVDPIEGEYQITWTEVDTAVEYILYEDTSIYMLNRTVAYNGTGLTLLLTDKGPSTFYYELWVEHENGTFEAITQVSTADEVFLASVYDEFLENPAMQAFIGDGAFDLYTFKGFVTIEFMSWIPLIAVLYLAYLASGAIAKEVDEKTLDPILATPVSRTRFFFEKYIAFSLVSFLMVFAAWLGLYAGAVTIDEPSAWLAPAIFGVLPLVFAIQSFAILTSIVFNEPRKAMGVSLLFIMLSYILYIGANLSDGLAKIKGWSVFTHYDYSGIMAHDAIVWGDAAVLLGAAAVLTGIALYMFNKKDIPS